MTYPLTQAMNEYAPIAIFVFNRPQHTRQMLNSLALNPEFTRSPIYIFCDGSRGPKDDASVAQTRAVVSELAPAHAQVVMRDKNMGLAPSVIAGVTEIVNRHGKIIVIEDDLVFSSTTLRYLNAALDHYEPSDQVMHVSAYMYPVEKKVPDLFFYREVTCWGWATWSRAWKHFIADTQQLIERVPRECNVNEFNIRGTIGFLDMLHAQARGDINSWAVRWYASMNLAKGLALHPGKSFVNNIGHDGSGVNCSEGTLFDTEVTEQIFSKFPDQIEESEMALQAMVDYRTPNRVHLFIAKALHKAKRMLLGAKATRSLPAGPQ